MTHTELLTLTAAILTAGQSASPEPERLSADEAVARARDLMVKAEPRPGPTRAFFKLLDDELKVMA